MSIACKIKKNYARQMQLSSRLKKKTKQLLRLKHSETPQRDSNSNAHQSQLTSFGRIGTLKNEV